MELRGKHQLLWIMGIIACCNLPVASAESRQCAVVEADYNESKVIVFDACSRNFVGSKEELSTGLVKVRVVNINTLHYKYTIGTQGVDYHTQSVPAALTSLIGRASPSVSQLDNVINSAKSAANVVAGIRKGACSIDEILVYQRSIDEHNSTLMGYSEGKLDNMLPYLRDKSLTNRDLREAMSGICKNNGCDIGSNIESINKVAKELYKSHFAWAGAYAAWTDLNKQQCVSQTAVLDLVNTKLKADYNTLETRKNVAINNQLIASNIYKIIEDKTVFPDMIETEFDVSNVDKLAVSVNVELNVSSFGKIDPSDAKNSLNEVATIQPAISSNKYTVSKFVSGRWVPDFSLGIGITDIAKTNYYINADGNVDSGIEDSDSLSLTALAHFYPTRLIPIYGDTHLTFSPSVGVMLRDKPVYLFGGSAVVEFSSSARMFVTYGRANGKVSELNGEEVGKKPNIDGVISTAEQSRYGDFKSITFSFSF